LPADALIYYRTKNAVLIFKEIMMQRKGKKRNKTLNQKALEFIAFFPPL
jgi:hypothetical protein